jgi:hypothetical protein
MRGAVPPLPYTPFCGVHEWRYIFFTPCYTKTLFRLKTRKRKYCKYFCLSRNQCNKGLNVNLSQWYFLVVIVFRKRKKWSLNLANESLVSVGFIFKSEEYFLSKNLMCLSLKKMYFDDKLNEFIKERITSRCLLKSANQVLRFLSLTEHCEFYFAPKTTHFCLGIDIYTDLFFNRHYYQFWQSHSQPSVDCRI